MRKGLSKGAKKQLLNITVLLALIALTLGILLSSNRELDFRDIGSFLRRSDPWFLTAAFGCMAGFILFEAISLHLICRALGHKCRFGSSIVYSTADVYYSAITPSAASGQPASAYYMVKDGMSGGRIAKIIMLAAYVIIAFLFVFRFRMPKLKVKGIVITIVIMTVILTALMLVKHFCCS